MLKLLVIADDFTGALDTGVQFSQRGIQTLVSTNLAFDYDEIDQDVEVLVLDTESRYLSFEAAYQQIKRIIVSAKKFKVPYIYKKVDSALRGNVSAEIKALLDFGQEKRLPFLPAYPEMKRVLINGNLYIDQVLVSESIFAADPYEPVTESNILQRLQQEAEISSELIKGTQIPEAAEGVLVFDAETDEELAQQLAALANAELLNISIGCAGFAKLLAKELFPQERPVPYALKNPLVVICGSVNPITKKQVEYVQAQNYQRISLTPQQLLAVDYWESPAGQENIQSYLTLLEEQPLVVFETLSEATTAGILAHSQKDELPAGEFRFRIGKALGKLTEALWQQHSENTFLFTGGDTLFQSMNILGVSEIKPIVEISPGVVLSTIEWQQRQMQVITKSGGFGQENLFEEISQLMQQEAKGT